MKDYWIRVEKNLSRNFEPAMERLVEADHPQDAPGACDLCGTPIRWRWRLSSTRHAIGVGGRCIDQYRSVWKSLVEEAERAEQAQLEALAGPLQPEDWLAYYCNNDSEEVASILNGSHPDAKRLMKMATAAVGQKSTTLAPARSVAEMQRLEAAWARAGARRAQLMAAVHKLANDRGLDLPAGWREKAEEYFDANGVPKADETLGERMDRKLRGMEEREARADWENARLQRFTAVCARCEAGDCPTHS